MDYSKWYSHEILADALSVLLMPESVISNDTGTLFKKAKDGIGCAWYTGTTQHGNTMTVLFCYDNLRIPMIKGKPKGKAHIRVA